jgi:Xaa-Pro aminopeptidase
VHDVGERGKPLAAGMAFTIEPGLYIREEALNDLPKTAENAALIENVRAAVEKYKNIGVRIEDSFLLVESGVENLSARVPRTLEDVERFLAESHGNSQQSVPRSR